MHSWGDDFKYFAEVETAADEIGQFCRKWGRINVTQTKEKYGTARVYTSFGPYQVQTIFYPGYHYIQHPKWLMQIYLPTWIGNLFFPYQKFIYRLAYKRALKKYPMIRKEILCVADYDEFLKGL